MMAFTGQLLLITSLVALAHSGCYSEECQHTEDQGNLGDQCPSSVLSEYLSEQCQSVDGKEGSTEECRSTGHKEDFMEQCQDDQLINRPSDQCQGAELTDDTTKHCQRAEETTDSSSIVEQVVSRLSQVIQELAAKEQDTLRKLESNLTAYVQAELRSALEKNLAVSGQGVKAQDRGLQDQLDAVKADMEQSLKASISELNRTTIQQLKEIKDQIRAACKGPYHDCTEWLEAGYTESGVYNIFVGDSTHPVYCDMDTDGGGWTVFQRRLDGMVNFELKWKQYKEGFGSLKKEFWLGNELIHQLTKHTIHALRVDLWDYEGEHVFAKYKDFYLRDEEGNYALKVAGYHENSTAGDGLTPLRGQGFSTLDRDNDGYGVVHISAFNRSGWWWKNIAHGSLNGLLQNKSKMRPICNWYPWKNAYEPVARVTMMIRPG